MKLFIAGVLLLAGAAGCSQASQAPVTAAISQGNIVTINNFVADGDSMTAGDVVGATSYVAGLSLNGAWTVTNKGIDGQTLATMVGNASANIDPLFVNGVTNVMAIWGGTNDIANSGQTAAQVHANLQTYCNARRAEGWKVLVVTTVSRLGADVDATIQAYNALTRANWPTYADGIVDVAGDARLGLAGAAGNPAFFLDGIHPNYFSNTQIITPLFNTAINALVATPKNFEEMLIVNSVTGGSGDASFTIAAPPMSTATGNLIVAGIRYDVSAGANSVTDVVDTAGNVYTPVSAVIDGGRDGLQFWYSPNAIGNPANVVTATFQRSGTVTGIACWEISGADPSNPFVNQGSGNSGGAGVTTLSTGSFATGADNEMILSMATTFATGETFTPGVDNGLDDGHFPGMGANQFYCGTQHQTVAGATVDKTVSVSWNLAAPANLAAVSFRAAALPVVAVAGAPGVR